MPNPFSSQKPKAVDQFEEVGGSFECQFGGCGLVVHEAKYFHVQKLLAWVCPNEHKSFIEDFKL